MNFEIPPIYVVNFNDDERKTKMTTRFSSIGFSLQFVPPVYISDNRLAAVPQNLNVDKRVWSIMLQHLDSIRHFVDNSSANHCIVCEDDILISKSFHKELPQVIQHFDKCQLDVLLLGYLMPYRIEKNAFNDEKALGVYESYSFYPYYEGLWGSQMYLISRNHAKKLLEKYTVEYAMANLEHPFSPDWTLTKDGHRALIYPMMVLEEGTTKTNHTGQNEFHQKCFETHYDSEKFF